MGAGAVGLNPKFGPACCLEHGHDHAGRFHAAVVLVLVFGMNLSPVAALMAAQGDFYFSRRQQSFGTGRDQNGPEWEQRIAFHCSQ